MSDTEIIAACDEVGQRLKEHDANRKLIEADLLRLQHICPHRKTWSDGGSYGGPDFASTYCEACGKRV